MKSKCFICSNKDPFKLLPIHSGYAGTCPICGWEKIIIVPNYKKECKNNEQRV